MKADVSPQGERAEGYVCLCSCLRTILSPTFIKRCHLTSMLVSLLMHPCPTRRRLTSSAFTASIHPCTYDARTRTLTQVSITHKHTLIRTHMRTHAHVHTRTHARVHARMQANTSHTCTDKHTHALKRTRKRMCVRMQACIHVHPYMHAHTNPQSSLRARHCDSWGTTGHAHSPPCVGRSRPRGSGGHTLSAMAHRAR